MTDETHSVGTVAGLDLTVADAPHLRDFYASVVGWRPQPVDMGEYADFAMLSPDGTWVAGVCHARGTNVDLPTQWLVYVTVADLDESLSRCADAGGRAVTAVKGNPGETRYCVIQDPAGAVLALVEHPPS